MVNDHTNQFFGTDSCLLAALYMAFMASRISTDEGQSNVDPLQVVKDCYRVQDHWICQTENPVTTPVHISDQMNASCISTEWIMCLIYITFITTLWIQSQETLNNENCSKNKTVYDMEEHDLYVNSGKGDNKQLNMSKDNSESPLSSLYCNDHLWRPTNTHLWIYTTPRYPDNHNPLLPLALQQQLDEMNPREYLSYVLKELTLEERESLMVDESQRRKTFLVNWPYDDQRSGVRMAQAGFYSLDAYDRVQCVFCRGSLHNWDTDETPMTEHARSFNFCRFIKGLECGNREYRSNMLSENDVKNVTRFHSSTNSEKQRGAHSESIDSGVLGISTNRASMVRYAPDATRIKTFSRWPTSCPITSTKMCEAGFYYTGFDDQVRCFYCAGGIKEWSGNDNPWEEHARWFPDCAFLIQQKGQAYVDDVHCKTPANKKSVRQTQSQKKAEKKEVEHKTVQQDMRAVCLKLGHSSDVINSAVVINGKQFEKIGPMLDTIYDIELNGTASVLEKSAHTSTNTNVTNSLSLDCPDEDRSRLVDQQGENVAPGRFDGSERRPRNKMGCRMCENTTENFVPATHVGLPCGHLVYCDSCNRVEERKSSNNSSYSVKCPFYKCGATLKGTIKVYFA